MKKLTNLAIMVSLASMFTMPMKSQSVEESPFVCIDIRQDSVLSAAQTQQRGAGINNEVSSSSVYNLLERFLKTQNVNLSAENEQVLSDANGNLHYRYDIAYKGIPVNDYKYNVITGNYTLRMLVDNVVVSTAQLIIR